MSHLYFKITTILILFKTLVATNILTSNIELNKPVEMAVENLFNDNALILGEKTSWGGGTI